MEPLLIVLALAGLLVGATGTWSPCGFSMIETIGPTGHTGGMRTTLAAAATFAPFAVLGGAITFGLLALAGQALGAGGTAAFIAAAVAALAAALAEARGTRIVPQVRRQLPIGWRTRFPMPLAAAGYGVLLGLGFTTFVLSYGVWALMGVCLALGDPLAGLVVGIAFGAGRALPIVALAPLADRPSGERACEAMAMRPGLLRGARAGDAVALSAVAAILIGGAGAADAASREVANASDPSVSGAALAYELRPETAVVERADGTRMELPGTDPAIGGPYAATIREGRIAIFLLATGAELASVAAPDADAVAISRDWLAFRQHRDGRDVISVAPIAAPAAPADPYRVAAAKSPSQLSRPAVGGRRIVYALAKRSANSLIAARLGPSAASRKEKVLSSRSMSFAGPSIAGRKIAYVATGRRRQTLRVKGLGGGLGDAVLSRRPGPPTLWTTALGARRAYVTIVGKGGRGKLISARR